MFKFSFGYSKPSLNMTSVYSKAHTSQSAVPSTMIVPAHAADDNSSNKAAILQQKTDLTKRLFSSTLFSI